MLRAVLILAASAAIAAGVAFALWEYFPYASFHRSTLEERFFLWEGILWMLGLVLICFGIPAALGTRHLLNTRIPSMAEIYSVSHVRPHRQDRFSFVPVWMVLTGIVFLVLATWARGRLLP